MSNRKTWIIGGVLVGINMLAGFLAYPHLPEKVPTHWNIYGEVDGWGSAWQGAFMLPLIMLGLLVLLIIIPKIDPKRSNYLKMGKTYGIFVVSLMVIFTAIYLGTLGASLGYVENLPNLIKIGIGILFIVIGNYMGKIKHNYTFGIKTPWTLANEEVWLKTHRMAGPFWIAGGFLLILTSMMESRSIAAIIGVSIFVLIFIPAAYSYVLYRKIVNSE